jgi:hypothetical protein
MELRELIERLEKATGPDRDIDIKIESWWMRAYGHRSSPVPHFTTSIDAALTLVPKDAPFVLTLTGVWAEHTPFSGQPIWEAGIPDQGSGDFEEYTIAEVGDFEASGTAPAPAIALCIAALKARRWSGAG